MIQAGLGIRGRSWTNVLADDPAVELAAVADPDPTTHETARATPAYATVEEAMARVACDAVLVASPRWRQTRPLREAAGDVLLGRWGEPPCPVEQPELPLTGRAATLHALRSAIETGDAPETAAADNVKSLAVTLGCVLSVESGETVDVPASLDAARSNEIPTGP